MTTIRKTGFRWSLGLLVSSFLLLAARVDAQEKALPIPSLRLVPADATTYTVSLRNREQLEAVLSSKSWSKLMSMPIVKMGRQMLEAEWNNPKGMLAPVRNWYDQPGHAEIVRFLGELHEEEVFAFSGKNAAEWLILAQELQAANQMAPLAAMIKEGPLAASQPEKRVKYLLQVLSDNSKRIVLPETVMGFKLSRTKPAQIAQWLESLEKALGQAVPALKQKFNKIQIQGADVYTLDVDGSMIPWNLVPFAQFEDQPGQFNDLVKHLTDMKLTIAVTVRDNYLLVSLGEGTNALKTVGPGLPNRLGARAEFAPLAKFADQKLTSVTYASKEFVTAVAGGDNSDRMAWINNLLKDAGLPADKLAKINKELKQITADLKRRTPEAGPVLSFAFLTKRGYESYTHDWTKNHAMDGSKPLTLLDHVGVDPLAFFVGRESGSGENYDLMVRMIKLAYENFEDLVVPQLPDEVKQPLQFFMKEAKPLFARLDKATGKLLLPSLDGQSGFVLDGQLKSKKWHQAMPEADKALPLPELALIWGVKDAAKFRQAFKEYRDVYNDLVDVIAQIVPGGIPVDIKLPEPKSKQVQGGTVYYYPLPEVLGLDPRLMPTAGVSDRVAAFTLSREHASRLLKAGSWKDQGGPLAGQSRPLASAAYIDFAGCIDMLNPWVQYALIQANQGDDVRAQVQTFMEILQVFRSHTSATAIENGVAVTHGETVISESPVPQDQGKGGKEKQEKKDAPKAGKETTPLKIGLQVNSPKAFQGYTLFSPLHSRKTFLIDMEGKIANTWEGPSTPAGCAYLLPNGNLLRQTLYEEKKTSFGTGGGAGGRMQEFSWDGTLVWDYNVASDKFLAHHDVYKMANGNILVLAGEMKDSDEVTAAGRKNVGNIRADFLLEVKPTGKTTGEVVWEWHMWDHLIQDVDKTKANFGDVAKHPELVDVNFGPGGKGGGKGGPGKGALDWTHCNAIDYNATLDQIMISNHNFSEVYIIDHGTTTAEAKSHTGGKRGKGGDILYRWGNPAAYRATGPQKLFVQHNSHWIPPGLPGAGHALVFNNGGGRPGSSVDEFVLPMDAKGIYTLKPESEKALWSYTAPNKKDFNSGYISGAERLPNGNTLVCSGADGIFFEVTADKEMVWKYINPLRKGTPGFETNGGLPMKGQGGGAPTAGAVFRAYRYAPNYPGLARRNLKATMTVEEMLGQGLSKKD